MSIDTVREDIESAISALRKVRSGRKLLPISQYAVKKLDSALAALSTMTDEQKLAEKYRLIALMNFETALANRELELGGWVSDHAYSIQLLDCQIAELGTDKEEPTP